ncbi:hypothetical protein [Brevibacterium spongiae]|uniref:Uncharacterized protein n=1 Tax=Brevibacterium spongiae TaxID=2909672 RepID=A0ABY5SVW4_9MICO|nr:hypothetical protein [Brevibacterium spongiae]UVI38036.1 hypothetical protein L1F31_18805 [Brevibacterium spongiae]
MNADYCSDDEQYLSQQSLTCAQSWLAARKLPADPESAQEMIAAYYPGGLHWFIAQHLISPDDTEMPAHP